MTTPRSVRLRALEVLTRDGVRQTIGSLKLDDLEAEDVLLDAAVAVSRSPLDQSQETDLLKTSAGVFNMSHFAGLFMKPMPVIKDSDRE